MTHGQVLEAMSGLMLSMFVAMLSSTAVSNALPTIMNDLGGSESSYTWVVTATLLATTAATPIWGKLSDLIDKKLLMQCAIVVFVAASLVAGLSQSIGMLIACRAAQGIGAGGILAMTQVIMAAMVSPRERGRYSGYLGATFAVATITGPLVGGVLVDSRLGWRACFYVGVPFAAAALLVLQRTLHLVTVRREVKVDYLGAALITGGVSVLLIWVSLAGHEFGWLSGSTAAYLAGGVLLLACAVVVELRVSEPVLPLRLFRQRTVTLATVASLFVGIALFSATIFLSQYFQIARNESPTASGLRTMPIVLGLAVSSLVVGRLVSSTGRWQRYLLGGSATATVGFGALGTLDAHTSFVLVAGYMALVGIGLAATMQNLVLSVQNQVAVRDLGAATATVSFFRSLGGAIGVSALGAVLAHRVELGVGCGLAGLGLQADALGVEHEHPGRQRAAGSGGAGRAVRAWRGGGVRLPAGGAAWLMYMSPGTFVLIIRRQSSVSASGTGPSSITQALLTSTSSRPSSSTVQATARRQAFSSVTSSGTVRTWLPRLRSRSASASSRSVRRAARATAAPARATAVDSPMPDEALVRGRPGRPAVRPGRGWGTSWSCSLLLPADGTGLPDLPGARAPAPPSHVLRSGLARAAGHRYAEEPRSRLATAVCNGAIRTPPSASRARIARRWRSTPARPTAHSTYCTAKAARKAPSEESADAPGVSRSSTTPTSRIAIRDATKPPTLTTPLALPSRAAGFSVRA